MEIVIVKEKMYGNEKEVLTIKDAGIYYESNNSFPTLLSDNKDIIDTLFTRFFSITYTWRQEYAGPRTMDGYKYLVTMDINHKRKSYKIQNKYPDNWEEFLDLKNSLLEGGYLQ